MHLHLLFMEIGRKMLLQCLARNSENATQASRNSCSHGFLHSHIPLIGIVGRRSPCSYFIMTNSTKICVWFMKCWVKITLLIFYLNKFNLKYVNDLWNVNRSSSSSKIHECVNAFPYKAWSSPIHKYISSISWFWLFWTSNISKY